MYTQEQKKRMLKLLAAKEKRSLRQKKWIQKYQRPILTLMLNIPGPHKVSPSYDRVLGRVFTTIQRDLGKKIIAFEYYKSLWGNYYIIACDINGVDLKKYCIKLEESESIGRILDLDVFDTQGQNISRKDLNLPQRKCLLCPKEARLCIRQESHSIEELENTVNHLVLNYLGEYKHEEKN
ncbi:MAG: citrate lyase holo-[acyl-carrier protein] synthase [Tissierellia bacterium]|nr:citrate lyase holo-[acyl-carrier protein] synthase [Tissierellia bacterium]